jgi:hypothetical protein
MNIIKYILILAEKHKECRTLRRPMNSWKDDIKIDLRNIACDGAHWIHAVQDR